MARLGSRYWSCTDCYVWFANGDAPSDWTEAQITEWLARIDARTEPFGTFVPGLPESQHSSDCTPEDRENGCDCDHDTFSRGSCDTCGSTLAGERHAVVDLFP